MGLGHAFQPDQDFPNLCGLLIPSTAPWPNPPHRKCGGTPDRHEQEETNMTLPQHSRFASWKPAEYTEGDVYKPGEHYGHSAIVKVREYKPVVVTSNSPNGAPAVIVDVHDLNDKHTYRDVLMMTGAIVDTFKAHAGGPPLVVQWEKAIAKNGRDYARPIPASERAIAAAEATYANGDPFAPTLGTITEEQAPF